MGPRPNSSCRHRDRGTGDQISKRAREGAGGGDEGEIARMRQAACEGQQVLIELFEQLRPLGRAGGHVSPDSLAQLGRVPPPHRRRPAVGQPIDQQVDGAIADLSHLSCRERQRISVGLTVQFSDGGRRRLGPRTRRRQLRSNIRQPRRAPFTCPIVAPRSHDVYCLQVVRAPDRPRGVTSVSFSAAVGRPAAASSGDQDDLARVPPLGDEAVSLAGLIERERPSDDRADGAVFDQLGERRRPTL